MNGLLRNTLEKRTLFYISMKAKNAPKLQQAKLSVLFEWVHFHSKPPVFYLQRQRRSMSPNSCSCCSSSSCCWGDKAQNMTAFGPIEAMNHWYISERQSLRPLWWPLDLGGHWGRFEVTEAILRPLRPFRDHLGHSDGYLTSEVTWHCFEAI